MSEEEETMETLRCGHSACRQNWIVTGGDVGCIEKVADPPDMSKPGFGHEWATELVGRRAWVLHTPTRMVSRVKAFYDGVERAYVSTANGKSVAGPVIELEDGNTFVAADEALFVPLRDGEADYFLYVQAKVAATAKEVAAFGAKGGIRKETALLLIGTALRATARITDLVSQKPARPAPGG